MATIHLNETTTSTPEQFVAGLTDFGPGRSKLFGNSADNYLEGARAGPGQADVTEGSGGVWERLDYDWSDPNRVVMTTTDSNVWGGHRATPTPSPAARRDDRRRRRRGPRGQEPQGTDARRRGRDRRQARPGEALKKDPRGDRSPEQRGEHRNQRGRRFGGVSMNTTQHID